MRMHAGITIAIDDRYEVWGSGIISIPWNFSVQDLKPQLLRLLTPAASQQAEVSGNTFQATLLSHPQTRYSVQPVCLGILGPQANTSCQSALANVCCWSHSILRRQSWQHVSCGSFNNAFRPCSHGLTQRALRLCPKSQGVIKPRRPLQSQQTLLPCSTDISRRCKHFL